LDALHRQADGPADFTAEEWTRLKEKLYHEGMLGHVVKDGIYQYRNAPGEYIALFRAMRDVFHDHGFRHPTASQIYNGAKLLAAGRIDPNRAISIRKTGILAKRAGLPLMSQDDYRRLDR
jgi:hypothetical protein